MQRFSSFCCTAKRRSHSCSLSCAVGARCPSTPSSPLTPPLSLTPHTPPRIHCIGFNFKTHPESGHFSPAPLLSPWAKSLSPGTVTASSLVSRPSPNPSNPSPTQQPEGPFETASQIRPVLFPKAWVALHVIQSQSQSPSGGLQGPMSAGPRLLHLLSTTLLCSLCSLRFQENSRHTPASGPLHWLFLFLGNLTPAPRWLHDKFVYLFLSLLKFTLSRCPPVAPCLSCNTPPPCTLLIAVLLPSFPCKLPSLLPSSLSIILYLLLIHYFFLPPPMGVLQEGKDFHRFCLLIRFTWNRDRVVAQEQFAERRKEGR